MPPPNAPVRNTDDSETESESEIVAVSELESDPDQYYIENQLGLPEYQHNIVRSSPPPADSNISNDLNNSEFFQGMVQKLTLQFAKTAYRVQISANKENEKINTDIVLTLGSKVRRTLRMNLHYSADLKNIQKNTKIDIQIENSYRSNPTININIDFRGKKHERGIEDDEGETNIHVQVKKTKN